MPETDRDARRELARDRIEQVIAEFTDVFAPNAEMPMQGDWVLLVCHDDAADAERGSFFPLNRRGQWSHRTIGLLISAADDYRHIVVDDD